MIDLRRTKIKVRNKRNQGKIFQFNEETLISNIKEFYKVKGSSPYPQRLKIQTKKTVNQSQKY
jgi:hypothetical protein